MLYIGSNCVGGCIEFARQLDFIIIKVVDIAKLLAVVQVEGLGQYHVYATILVY